MGWTSNPDIIYHIAWALEGSCAPVAHSANLSLTYLTIVDATETLTGINYDTAIWRPLQGSARRTDAMGRTGVYARHVPTSAMQQVLSFIDIDALRTRVRARLPKPTFKRILPI